VVHRIVDAAFELLRTLENVDRAGYEADIDPELAIARRSIDFPSDGVHLID
jgi:hypothetical protein